MFPVVTIVGVGLIGGSIGLASKRRGLAGRVRGLGRNRDTLERARTLGAIDEAALDPAEGLRGADLVVFCTPVDRIAAQALEYAPYYAPGAVVTDAGSTKASIVAALEGRLRSGVSFVGSHPLAGSEKRGPEHADANLFEKRWTVLTRTPRTDMGALERVSAFWQGLGSRVTVMTPEDHDRALARTSHLPHLVAAALAGMLAEEHAHLAATGFRDTTRIAAGDPALWTAIFTHNRDAMLDGLDELEGHLAEYRQALEANDTKRLDALLGQAKKVRDALGS